MTNEPEPNAGSTDFSAILDEQKAVLTAMNDKIKSLESRIYEKSECKIGIG